MPQPGPMGWWEHDTDHPLRTLAKERAIIGRMQEEAPALFTPITIPKIDKFWLDLCMKKMAEEGIEDGWDLTIVERVCGIDLDQIAKQIIGSCVATSHILLLALRALLEIVILGSSEKLLGHDYSGVKSVAPFGCFSYRTGRKLAGINGNSDGSMCGPQLAGTARYGYLPCDTPGLTSDYYPEPKSTSLYRRWGANDSLMNQFLEHAAPTTVTTAIECRTADEAKSQITEHLAPLQICSGQGFRATNTRLPNGWTLWTRGGSWSHSMQVVGIFKLANGNWYAKIRNQWGKYHNGRVSFIVALEEFSSWIRNAVAISIGELKQRPFDGDHRI